jgi:predicted ATPase
MALATLLIQPKETMPAIIIIDEPELGLHPVAIDKLASLSIILKLRILLSFQEKKRLEI